MTFLLSLWADGKEEVYLDDGNWLKIKPGRFLSEYLQPVVLDHRINGRIDTPDFSKVTLPSNWSEMDIRIYTMALCEGYTALLPTPYLSKITSTTPAKTLGRLEKGGLLAWDDLENPDTVDFNPSLRDSKDGVYFAEPTPRKYKIGFMDTLKEIWDGAAWPEGKAVQAAPQISEKDVFGWQIIVSHPVQLPIAEIFFLTTFNVRKMKLCFKCGHFHWGKKHIICLKCRRENEKKTPEEVFKNTLIKAKGPGRESITPEQYQKVLNVLKNHDLETAKKRYEEFKGINKIRRKN